MLLKKSLEDYRKGASGALLDEYERAIVDLTFILQDVSKENYSRTADAETKDEDCRSVQMVLSHVVHSGYAYANYIRAGFEIEVVPAVKRQISYPEIQDDIDKMLGYTVETFEGRWELMDAAMDNHLIKRWGASYSLEQMIEHAIVHVLRHRRQIEKFILKFKAS